MPRLNLIEPLCPSKVNAAQSVKISIVHRKVKEPRQHISARIEQLESSKFVVAL